MIRKIFELLLVASVATLAAASASNAAEHTYVKTPDKKNLVQHLGELAGLFEDKKSYALIIGVSGYREGYDALPTETDAKRMFDYFRDQAGFDYIRMLTVEAATPEIIGTEILGNFRRMDYKKNVIEIEKSKIALEKAKRESMEA